MTTKKKFVWTEEIIDYVVSEWQRDRPVYMIAHHIGITERSVHRWIQANREKYKLDLRPGDPGKTLFDKQWYGRVPYLHWSITRSWGCQ